MQLRKIMQRGPAKVLATQAGCGARHHTSVTVVDGQRVAEFALHLQAPDETKYRLVLSPEEARRLVADLTEFVEKY